MSFDCCGDGLAAGETFTETASSIIERLSNGVRIAFSFVQFINPENPVYFIVSLNLLAIGLGLGLFAGGYWLARRPLGITKPPISIGHYSQRGKLYQGNVSPSSADAHYDDTDTDASWKKLQ